MLKVIKTLYPCPELIYASKESINKSSILHWQRKIKINTLLCVHDDHAP